MSKTIDFFNEISKIPRESGNEENIIIYANLQKKEVCIMKKIDIIM